jgi:predicted ester cyclase
MALLVRGGTVQITDCERVWIEGLNRGDISVADEVFASEGVIHISGSPDPNLSVEGFKQMISGLLSAFPDMRITIEDQIVAGDKVATRWSAEGTNNGPFGTVPATGRRVRINGLLLDRVAGGKVVERWEQWDQMSMMQQLGLA